jgi:excisionase family DNA binding protein
VSKPFLSIKEAAEHLNVDYKTIYRLVRAGELPAGKIGGVYRIRAEELDRFFDRQTERAPAQAEWTPLPPGTGELIKCGRCYTIIPDEEQIGGPCNCDGCDAVLCSRCWSAYPDRCCEAHRASPAEKLAAARTRLSAGEIPVLVTALEARQRELGFINRFERKIHEITSIRHPFLDNQVYRVGDWSQRREVSDETVTLMQLLRTGYLDKATGDRLPANQSVRFRVGDRPGQPVLWLEARSVSHLAAHVEDGFDTRPAGLDDLMPHLRSAMESAEAGQAGIILGVAATTGWEREAAEYLTAPRTGFTHHLVRACLIDLQSGTFIYNRLDHQLEPFVGLFTPELPEEQVARAAAFVEHELQLRASLSLEEVTRQTGLPEALARRAFEQLAAGAKYRVMQLEPVGSVISPAGPMAT